MNKKLIKILCLLTIQFLFILLNCNKSEAIDKSGDFKLTSPNIKSIGSILNDVDQSTDTIISKLNDPRNKGTFVDIGDTGFYRIFKVKKLENGDVVFTGWKRGGFSPNARGITNTGMFNHNTYKFSTLDKIFDTLDPESITLSNGKNLILDSNKIYIYDPKLNLKINLKDKMLIPRSEYSYVIQNNKILIFSGYLSEKTTINKDKKIVSDIEIYDPIKDKSFIIGKLQLSGLVKTILLKDGKILAFHGSSIEIFNPSTKKVELIKNTINPHLGVKPVLLQNGKVLLAGGVTEISATNKAEIFDPKINDFISTGNMNYKRMGYKSILLEDGNVLIIGGMEDIPSAKGTYGPSEYFEAEVYIPN